MDDRLPRFDLHDRLGAAHSALVVVDMQNDFCAPGGYVNQLGKDVSGYAALLAPLQRAIDAARQAGVTVVWLRASYADASVSNAMRVQKQRMGIKVECCVPGSWGYAYFGPQPAPGEAEFDKHNYSGFSQPRFDAFLAEKGIETVVFCGVQTNVCVEATLRDAHSHGYYVALLSDAVASHTPPLHDATLANVGFLLGDVLSVDTWAALLHQ